MIPIRRLLRGYRRFAMILAISSVAYVLFHILTFAYHESEVEAVQDDRSKYICYNGKCISKITLELKNASMKTFKSMESCRLLCGEYANLWPIPTSEFQLGKKLLPIDPTYMDLIVFGSDTVRTFMYDAFRIFQHNLITECGEKRIAPSKQLLFEIRIEEDSVELKSETAESYDMNISYRFNQHKVVIFAKTVFGARHALETTAQLTSREFTSYTCKVMMMDYCIIQDSPIFKHRGILIDTARQFIPVEDLERTISAMAANKLNVLHWHATDTHSFPLQLSNIPYLASYGAYSAEEVYTDETIVYLVEYAKLRGVRIILEIDTPAHAGNGWQFGPDLGLGELVLCYNEKPWKISCRQPPCGQLNPANNFTYEVLADIYKSLQRLIPSDEVFHMGGNEVYYQCWDRTEKVIAHMTQRGYPRNETGFLQLWAEFQSRALEAWDKAIDHSKTKIILWSSALTFPQTIGNFLSKDRFIIEVTTGSLDKIPKQLLELGYEVIFASTDWSLDHGFDDETTYHEWKTVYDNSIPKHEKVLGGEAALWTEYADENSMDTRLWPRASALAERLWTYPVTTAIHATYRLAEMRERLVRRGVSADPIMPHWCYLNEGLC